MSDQHSPAQRGSRRKGNPQQPHVSDNLAQQDLVSSDTNRTKSATPNTPAKKNGPRQTSGPGQQHRGGGARGTPDSKRIIAQMDGNADGQHPPRTGSMTPAKIAYAGPTFHASPAASTLPIPSRFFSKSMPSDQAPSGLQSRLDADDEDQSPRPFTAASNKELERADAEPVRREESPLDFFFNAQKAERSGNRNSSPLATGPRAPPPSAQRRGPSARGTPNPSKNMFMMELDGAGESNEALPDISSPVPFKERMQAVRTNSSPGHIPSQHDSAADRHAKTLELKKLLSLSSDGFSNGFPSHGQAPPFAPGPTHSGHGQPQFQGQQHVQQGSPFRGHGHGPYSGPGAPDAGSPFASPRGVQPGPYYGPQHGEHPYPMHGFTGPPFGSPARQQPPHGQFAVELPGSAGYVHGRNESQQYTGPASTPQVRGQQDTQQGSASGVHNQIARMSQMEDSLRKILKLDAGNGK